MGSLPIGRAGLWQAADFRGMTVEQIDAEVAATKRALFDLRLKRATRQEYKSSNFKFNKKKVRVSSAATHTANRSHARVQAALP